MFVVIATMAFRLLFKTSGNAFLIRAFAKDRDTEGRGLPQAWPSPATFYKFKSGYGGMKVSDAARLKALEDESAKLKRLLADMMPGRRPIIRHHWRDCLHLNGLIYVGNTGHTVPYSVDSDEKDLALLLRHQNFPFSHMVGL